MNNSLILLILSILLILCRLQPSTESSENIRATWIDQSHVTNEAHMEQIIKTLKTYGINRIYIDGWNYGLVFFESNTMRNTLGPIGISPKKIVPWAVKYGHQYGMQVYCWMQYGFVAGDEYENPFKKYAIQKGWLLKQPYAGAYWMDPRTEATEFLAGITKDAIDTGVDGVQVDDHFGCPVVFSFCSMELVFDFTKRFTKIVKSASRSVPISLSPWAMPYAKDTFYLDWPMMVKFGYFQEAVPQIYAMEIKGFNEVFNGNEKYLDNDVRQNHLIGISCQDDQGTLVPWSTILNSLKVSKEHHYGVVIWHVNGILKSYPDKFHEAWG